jgi:SAM-dependent methyltransferase
VSGPPSNHWQQLTGTDADAGARYAARFAGLATSGADVHGEARLCASLAPAGARVLDAGCGTGRVAARLAELGYLCVGVDADRSMLAQAQALPVQVSWLLADLAALDTDAPELGRPFDLVVAAGNVLPLLADGTHRRVVGTLARLLAPGGLLVAGFGLDPEHLPLPWAPVDLESYDRWCADAGLEPRYRFATWDGDPFDEGGYAVSVHRRRTGAPPL